MLKSIPGALMIVPLLIGAVLNTVDKSHLPAVERVVEWLGAAPVVTAEGEQHYEFLKIGGFSTALTGPGATTLIAMFLVCVAAQMDFGVGRQALKKGTIILAAKLAVAVGCGYLIAATSDPWHGWLGLSTVAVIAAMSNGNGGLFLALTGQYGDRSDVGAVSVISLNDGPFFTLVALGLLGETFPAVAFLAVLLPMIVGFALGQFSESFRQFLAPGEKLCIPFFAFALGTTMSFATFLDLNVLGGGLFLGIATVLLTGIAATMALWLCGERGTVAGFAEASTAGNAVQTPLAVAIAAGAGIAADASGTPGAVPYAQIVPLATAQISISVITTAILCPIAVLFWKARVLKQIPDVPLPETESLPRNASGGGLPADASTQSANPVLRRMPE